MVTDGLNPFTVLLFLGALLAGAALVATYVYARVTKREPLARLASRVFLGGVGVYLVLVLVGSLTSHSRVLAPGEEKHICEDDQGNQYRGSTEALTRLLIPGESYTTDIAFEVPFKATGLRLILRSADPETPFLIGHENAPFHGKTTFALPS